MSSQNEFYTTTKIHFTTRFKHCLGPRNELAWAEGSKCKKSLFFGKTHQIRCSAEILSFSSTCVGWHVRALTVWVTFAHLNWVNWTSVYKKIKLAVRRIWKKIKIDRNHYGSGKKRLPRLRKESKGRKKLEGQKKSLTKLHASGLDYTTARTQGWRWLRTSTTDRWWWRKGVSTMRDTSSTKWRHRNRQRAAATRSASTETEKIWKQM